MNITKKRYYEHKQNAKRRGIPFELTFDEWFSIWHQSGKWKLRGKGKGSYVMSRINDIGSYSIGNVYINTHEINAGDVNRGKNFSDDHSLKISNSLKGKKKNINAVIKNAAAQLKRPKYNCAYCNKLISGVGNLKQHVNSKHKEVE